MKEGGAIWCPCEYWVACHISQLHTEEPKSGPCNAKFAPKERGESCLTTNINSTHLQVILLANEPEVNVGWHWQSELFFQRPVQEWAKVADAEKDFWLKREKSSCDITSPCKSHWDPACNPCYSKTKPWLLAHPRYCNYSEPTLHIEFSRGKSQLKKSNWKFNLEKPWFQSSPPDTQASF